MPYIVCRRPLDGAYGCCLLFLGLMFEPCKHCICALVVITSFEELNSICYISGRMLLGINMNGATKVAPFMLFCFYLFLHVYEMFLAVIKFVLQESHFLRRNNMHTSPVFQLPFSFQAYEALVDIGGYVRVYVQVEFLNANLVD